MACDLLEDKKLKKNVGTCLVHAPTQKKITQKKKSYEIAQSYEKKEYSQQGNKNESWPYSSPENGDPRILFLFICTSGRGITLRQGDFTVDRDERKTDGGDFRGHRAAIRICFLLQQQID
jgi:hypothetical protein